jgi:hypothetical protein
MSECDICEVGLLQRIYRKITGRHPENPTYCEDCSEQTIQELTDQVIEHIDRGSFK